MATIILMWKPQAWPWTDLPEKVRALRAGEPCELTWSVGRGKNIAVGSRAFLLRVGDDLPGFMASGWVATAPKSRPHWDAERAAKGERDNYVDVTLDMLLNPAIEPPLEWRLTAGAPLKEALQHLQGSGKSIPDPAAEELEERWSQHVGHGRSIGDPGGLPEWREGDVRWRYVKHRSRERSLRRAKVEEAMKQGRLRCEVPGCGFDFEAQYGAIGRGFAHVHHLRPLAALDGEQSVSLEDLAIVCANCHAMVHRNGECRELSVLVQGAVQAEP
jgi:5-methylcytosine-specific restriction protein A